MASLAHRPLSPQSSSEPRRKRHLHWTRKRPRSASDVARQVATLGVRPGDVVLVHVSYRAVRPIKGGPAGLLAGLQEAVGPQGTLVMPSYTGEDDRLFDPSATPADPELGVVADTFWRLPGVLRNDHPFAFAARGPVAPEITSDPIAFPPHGIASPVGRVLNRDGRVLLVGVGHESNTTIHLAELLAGVRYRRPKHCTVLVQGLAGRVDYEENDHCCRRFGLMDGWLRAERLQVEGPVGHAHARLVDAKDVVDCALARLARDPALFLHEQGSGCEECDEAWRSLP